MKHKYIASLILLGLVLLATAGCKELSDHVVLGGGASLGADGKPTGSISIQFKDYAGNAKAIVYTQPARARGWDADGAWVSLNAARDLAVRAYKSGQSVTALALELKWSPWDIDNAAGILALLKEHGCNPASL